MGVIRMVRSWNEWLAIWGYDINAGAPQFTDDAAGGTVSDLIGDQLRAYTNSFPFVVDGE